MFDPNEVPKSLQEGAIARVLRALDHNARNESGDQAYNERAIIETAAKLKSIHADTLAALEDLYAAERALLTNDYIAGALKQRAELAASHADTCPDRWDAEKRERQHAATIAAYLAERAEYDRQGAEYRAFKAQERADQLTRP